MPSKTSANQSALLQTVRVLVQAVRRLSCPAPKSTHDVDALRSEPEMAMTGISRSTLREPCRRVWGSFNLHSVGTPLKEASGLRIVSCALT